MPPRGTLTDRVKKDLWTPTHSQILFLHSEGRTPGQIALEVGVKLSAVKEVLQSPELLKNLQTVRENVVQTVVTQRLEMMSQTTLKEARKTLENASNMAVDVVVKIAKGTIEGSRVQLEACKDILDRVGLKALVITETRERVYAPEEVISAKKVLDEAQEIVKRLSNNTSPYILGDTRVDKLVSSDTDLAHATQPSTQV